MTAGVAIDDRERPRLHDRVADQHRIEPLGEVELVVGDGVVLEPVDERPVGVRLAPAAERRGRARRGQAPHLPRILPLQPGLVVLPVRPENGLFCSGHSAEAVLDGFLRVRQNPRDLPRIGPPRARGQRELERS